MGNQLLDDSLIPEKINPPPKKKEINNLMLLSWTSSFILWLMLSTYFYTILDQFEYFFWNIFFEGSLYKPFLFLLIILTGFFYSQTLNFFGLGFMYLCLDYLFFTPIIERFYFENFFYFFYALQFYLLIFIYLSFKFIKWKFKPSNFQETSIFMIVLGGFPIINLIYWICSCIILAINYFLYVDIEICILINFILTSALSYVLYTKGINWYFEKGQNWLMQQKSSNKEFNR
ncbi:MAG: hypothetical protein MK207_09190 [Saprospiraceae bacterium]|nr:hypothetical protein [Saprospiraceae bacterium]